MKIIDKIFILIFFLIISCTSKTEMTKEDFVVCHCEFIKATNGRYNWIHGSGLVDPIMGKILANHGFTTEAFNRCIANYSPGFDNEIIRASRKIENEFRNNCLDCSKIKPLSNYLISKSCWEK